MKTPKNGDAITKISAVVIVVIIVAVAGVSAYILLQNNSSQSNSSLNSLVQQADQEGSVTIYTVITSSAMQAVISAFNKAYPKITVNYYSGSANDVLTRVQSEAQGGVNAVDVVEATYLDNAALMNNSLLASYVPPGGSECFFSRYNTELLLWYC